MFASCIIFRNMSRHTTIKTRAYSKHQNPFTRTWRTISEDMPAMFGKKKDTIRYPEHADIVIIGGGFIGSSVAYHLKTRAGNGLSVVVLEKDMTYKETLNNLSLGTIVQHFSLPENIHLAQYGADFFRNIKEHFKNDIDLEYWPSGQLVLASEKYAHKLEHNVTIQREFGIRNLLLTVDDIKQSYPWINTQDVHLGCISNESEGLFNSRTLLRGLVQHSQELGADYVNAEVTGFELEQQRDVLMEGVAPGTFRRITRVIFKTPDNEEHSIKFAACILAAGDKSGQVGELADIGTGDGLLGVPLPVQRREHKVYSIANSANITGLGTPLINDTSGLWIRRNGLESDLVCGHVPLLLDDVKDLPTDEFYNSIIEPSLLNRIPEFKNTKVNTLTTEIFDCNTYDDAGILGSHPYHNNLYIATGFGREGCQHAPGIGRAISELIIDSHYTSIDLTRLSFDRLLTGQPLMEFNIY